ncbi:MAG: UDP-2,3-diacylglucosamine diphosphatase LpxI [Planctomycetota bacterium]
MTDRPLGIIAGNGTLPAMVAAEARAAGRAVVCAGLAGQVDEALVRPACDRFRRVGLIRLGQWARTIRRFGATEAVMIGGVRKARVYDPLSLVRQVPDWRAARLWFNRLRHDRRSQRILAAVADELAMLGVTLIDSTTYLSEHLADDGVMAGRMTDALEKEIEMALPVLMSMNALEVGQALALKGGDVLAVEAVEGTDAMIERAGRLCRAGGWTLVKGPGPGKDMRFDVPTVGVATIERLAAAGGKALVLIAGRVIVADKPAVVAAAEKAGVVVVGVANETTMATQ